MRINLRGGDICVAEHGLNASDVGAVHQKVGGEAVAHSVRTNMFSDASQAGVFVNGALNATSR